MNDSTARCLVVVADDYGIGPETSRGILDLARQGVLTSSVLMINSPYAIDAVRAWRNARRPFAMGWHPCLTMDRPVLPATRVPTLVNRQGGFHSLGRFLAGLLLDWVNTHEIRAELQAQLNRFLELVGQPPAVVNGHKHIQVFPPVGTILLDVLARQNLRPYFRRLTEPLALVRTIPGARLKRLILGTLGRRLAVWQERVGFPGNGCFAGLTDPRWIRDPLFLARWLRAVPGSVVEWMCHPGYLDTTLLGRDCTTHDGQLQRRVDELNLLTSPRFHEVCRESGFQVVAPHNLSELLGKGLYHAA
jgi:predicted glycoside hydrolase/deacetylase ChbG (UPF0249 family)